MEFRETTIPGCFEIQGSVSKDTRGAFVKVYQMKEFAKRGLATEFVEEFYSFSHKNVLRGLHVQIPPGDAVKVIYCPHGEVFDVLIDLRKGSPMFGKFETFRLSANAANQLYVAAGVAHGFYVLSENAILVYQATKAYVPEYDTGIRWDTAGISWPSERPIISQRDRSFEPLQTFSSPFIFRK